METRDTYKKYDGSIAGLVVIAVGNIKDNVFKSTGKRSSGFYVLKNSIVGRLTGYSSDNWFEVKLFNPVWNYNGEPMYYYAVNDSYSQFVDDSEARLEARTVFRDYSTRDTNKNTFPHVAADYKSMCYNPKQDAFAHWNVTDTYFGSADWRREYINQVLGGNGDQYVFVGENYDPKPIDSFGIVNLIPSARKLKAIFETYWLDSYVIFSGICLSKTNNLPTVNDIFVNGGTDYPFKFDSGNPPYIEVIDLEPDTTYFCRPFFKRNNGTYVYGAMQSFSTLNEPVLPVLILDIPEVNLTQSSAKIIVRCFDTGDSSIVSRGIKIGSTIEAVEDVEIINVSTQRWEANLVGLLPATRYYVQVYATTEDGTSSTSTYVQWQELSPGWAHPVENKTGYFTTKQVAGYPVLYEKLPTNITDSSVILGGGISSDGGSTILQTGFVYSSENIMPTVLDAYIDSTAVTDDNTFYINVLNLKAASKFYYRAAARTSKGWSYSPGSGSFITGGVSLKTLSVSLITKNSAKVSAIIESSESEVTERGICVGLMTQPTLKTSADLGLKLGSYEANLTALQSGKLYYVRSYAIAAGKVYYGSEMTFITLADSTSLVPVINIVSSTTDSEGTWATIRLTSMPVPVLYIGIGISIVPPDNFGDFIDYFESEEPVIEINRDYRERALYNDTSEYYVTPYANYGGDVALGAPVRCIYLPNPVGDFDVTHQLDYNSADNVAKVIISSTSLSIIKWGVVWSSNQLPLTDVLKRTKESSLTNVIVLDNVLPIGITYIQAYAVDQLGAIVYSNVQSVINADKTPISTDDVLTFPENAYMGQTHEHKGNVWVKTEIGWEKKSAATPASRNLSAAIKKGNDDIIAHFNNMLSRKLEKYSVDIVDDDEYVAIENLNKISADGFYILTYPGDFPDVGIEDGIPFRMIVVDGEDSGFITQFLITRSFVTNKLKVYVRSLIDYEPLEDWIDLIPDNFVVYDFAHGAAMPGDGISYYIGSIPDLAPTNTYMVSRSLICQVSGYVTEVSLLASVGGSVGSNEYSTFAIHNHTKGTSKVFATDVTHSTSEFLKNYKLSSPLEVIAGDQLYIRWMTPNWITNPTTVRHRFDVKILNK